MIYRLLKVGFSVSLQRWYSISAGISRDPYLFIIIGKGFIIITSNNDTTESVHHSKRKRNTFWEKNINRSALTISFYALWNG